MTSIGNVLVVDEYLDAREYLIYKPKKEKQQKLTDTFDSKTRERLSQALTWMANIGKNGEMLQDAMNKYNKEVKGKDRIVRSNKLDLQMKAVKKKFELRKKIFERGSSVSEPRTANARGEA